MRFLCAILRPVSPLVRTGFLAAALLFGASSAATGQVRGMPVFFESFYYQARLGLQVGRGGELDGTSLVAEGAYQLGVGRRRRVSFAAAAGTWFPPVGSARFQFALSTQVRLDPAPGPGEVKTTTVRGIAGLAALHDGATLRWSVPLGVGVGHAFMFPIARIEPWVVPQVIWAARIGSGGSVWKAAVSSGVTVGGARIGGLRLGTQCCVGGLAWSASVSKWF